MITNDYTNNVLNSLNINIWIKTQLVHYIPNNLHKYYRNVTNLDVVPLVKRRFNDIQIFTSSSKSFGKEINYYGQIP